MINVYMCLLKIYYITKKVKWTIVCTRMKITSNLCDMSYLSFCCCLYSYQCSYTISASRMERKKSSAEKMFVSTQRAHAKMMIIFGRFFLLYHWKKCNVMIDYIRDIHCGWKLATAVMVFRKKVLNFRAMTSLN